VEARCEAALSGIPGFADEWNAIMGSRNSDSTGGRRGTRRSKPSPPPPSPSPLSVEAAAAALLSAFAERWGLDGVDAIWIDGTHVGASCSDGSNACLARWRSSTERDCGIVPGFCRRG
jgi:hypothetical protein